MPSSFLLSFSSYLSLPSFFFSFFSRPLLPLHFLPFPSRRKICLLLWCCEPVCFIQLQITRLQGPHGGHLFILSLCVHRVGAQYMSGESVIDLKESEASLPLLVSWLSHPSFFWWNIKSIYSHSHWLACNSLPSQGYKKHYILKWNKGNGNQKAMFCVQSKTHVKNEDLKWWICTKPLAMIPCLPLCSGREQECADLQ